MKIVVSGGLLTYLLKSENISLSGLWDTARSAEPLWLLSALVLYLLVILIGAWRWQLFLAAQHVQLPFKTLTQSYLVATFFNNFLPSNVGGDVVRIADTTKPAKSRTVATMVVLVDRGIGLLGLGFVAALGATIRAWDSPTIGPVGPGLLWSGVAVAMLATAWAVWKPHGVGALLRPFQLLHQEWVGERIEQLVRALHRFRDAPGALVSGLIASITIQGLLVLFYSAIAQSLGLSIPFASLAVVVPISGVVQMLPVSVGGLGVRESTFVFYLKSLGMARQSALTLSLMSWILILVFSVSGAVAYLLRRKH